MACYNESSGQTIFNGENGVCDDKNYCTIDFCNVGTSQCEHFVVKTCRDDCANVSSNGQSCYNSEDFCEGKCDKGDCTCDAASKRRIIDRNSLWKIIVPSVFGTILLLIVTVLLAVYIWRRKGTQSIQEQNVRDDDENFPLITTRV